MKKFKDELEYFKSDEFRIDIEKMINADTWDIGKPKIIGQQNGNRYEVVKLYKDGSHKVVSYCQDGIQHRLNDEQEVICIYYKNYYMDACHVHGNDLQSMYEELVNRKEEFKKLQEEFDLKEDEDF